MRNTDSKFVDVSSGCGDVFRQAWVGRGLAIGDIDNDGRIDAVVSTNEGLAHIVHNETTDANHWITLRMRGHKSNRDGIGASIKLTTGQAAQWATVTTTGSYLSASNPRTHFGLGKEKTVQSIEVRWPSGIRQTLRNVAADQFKVIEEPDASSP